MTFSLTYLDRFDIKDEEEWQTEITAAKFGEN